MPVVFWEFETFTWSRYHAYSFCTRYHFLSIYQSVASFSWLPKTMTVQKKIVCLGFERRLAKQVKRSGIFVTKILQIHELFKWQ